MFVLKQINTCSLVDGKKEVNFGVKNRLHYAESCNRVNKNYITREFYLHRDVAESTSRCIFEAVYHTPIDGISSHSQHPTMKRLAIGYKYTQA